MTAQINDRVFHRKIKYELSEESGGPLYNPRLSGVSPVSSCTGCHRGFHVSYEVQDDRLFLIEASFWLTKKDHARAMRGENPLFPGLAATEGCDATTEFRNIGIDIHFTGGLLITDKFIREPDVNLGFRSAWKYEEVYELIFESGRLIEEHDHSRKMAAMRGLIRDQTAGPKSESDRHEIGRWIDECFMLKYDY